MFSFGIDGWANGGYHRDGRAQALADQWHPQTAGFPLARFNDLPPELHGNVNRAAPFGGRPGTTPALRSEEIDDRVRFLHPLTDGHRPAP